MLNPEQSTGDDLEVRSWLVEFLDVQPEVLFRVGFALAKRVLNGDRDAAEDVVQEAFIRVLNASRRNPTARPDDPVGYFCSAVASAAKDHLKGLHAAMRGGGERPISLDVEGNLTIVSRGPGPMELASQSELIDRIYAAIRLLTPDHCAILLLAFDPVAGDWSRLSHAELSDELGIDPAKVKSRLFEAKKRLVALLRDLESGEEGVSA